MSKETDMALYIVHQVTVSNCARMIVNEGMEHDEARQYYEKAMENARGIVQAKNYDANMKELARGVEAIDPLVNGLRSRHAV